MRIAVSVISMLPLIVGCQSKTGFRLDGELESTQLQGPKSPARTPAVSSASLASNTLTLHGSSLDAVTDVSLSQNGTSVSLQILNKTADVLTAAVTGSAHLSRLQLASLLLNTAEASTPVVLTVDLSGAVVSNFTSTGISDLATSTALVLSADNKVGIGTVSPDDRLAIHGTDLTNGLTISNDGSTAASYPGLWIVNHRGASDQGGFPEISLGNRRGTSLLATPLQPGDLLGQVSFWGHGVTKDVSGAQIRSEAGQAFGDSAAGSDLVFSTSLMGATAPSEKVRITAAGNVGIGTAATTSVLTVNGAISTAVAAKTAAYTLTGADSVVLADASSGALVMTLPSAVGIGGREYVIKKTDASNNTVSVAASSGQTVDGAPSAALAAPYQYVKVVSDGANWMVIGGNSQSSTGGATLFTNGDTYVTGASPSNNYYGMANLTLNSATTAALFSFDLSVVPAGTVVRAAYLTVWVNAITTPGNLDLAPITSSWTDSTVTWNTIPTTGAVVSSAAVSAAAQPVTFNVTSIVRSWLAGSSTNYGLLLKPNGATSVTVRSKEFTSGFGVATLTIW